MSNEKLDLEQGNPIMIPDSLISSQKYSPKIVQINHANRRGSNVKISKLKNFMRARLTILNWIGDYNAEWGINDLIAGATLGLTIIPESIACALLAGLPAHYGLCSAFIGSFIYLFFGTIQKVIMGPTSLVALVSVQFTVGKPIEFAFLLTFLSGVVQIILGCLQMGLIFEFISLPVIKAFSTATAVLVIESQVKVLLGIKYLVAGLPQSIQTLSTRIHETNMGDLAMGIGAMTFLVAVDQIEKYSHRRKLNKVQRNFLLYLSFSRNTLIVLITALITFIWLNGKGQAVPYALSENKLSGLPNFSWPSLTVNSPEYHYSFWDVLKELNVGIIVIPIVGILTNFSIGKITPKNEVNPNQELVTVGICNIFGSCVQSMPTSGAFSRCAISTACGLKTPMANLYSGIIVLLALSYISPYFNYIPKATLAAILICSIYTLIDFQLPRRLWHESKREFSVWLLCFLVCVLFGVEVGLFVSILFTVLNLLFVWARPDITVAVEQLADTQYVRITPVTAIFFPSTAYLNEQILKAFNRYKPCSILVIDCIKIFDLDYTAVQSFTKLANDLNQNNEDANFLLIFFRPNSKLQNLIEPIENCLICSTEETLHECLLKANLQNGCDENKMEDV